MLGPSRTTAFVVVTFVYVLAAAVAGYVAWRTAGGPLWQIVALADVAATVVVFGFSVACNNSSLYDPYWSVAPMLIAPALALPSSTPWGRRVVVTVLVLAWGARLTWNWARGWQGLAHEDWRYVDLRTKTGRAYWPVSLVGLHLMPTLCVYLGCLSLVPALVTGARALNLVDGLAVLVTLGAITVETVADEQLRAFRRSDPAPGRILDVGLWAHSRHPNYLGEILFWWGLFLFALAAEGSAARWTVVGPVCINALFVAISVPMLDARSCARRPDYGAHMRRLPGIVPRPWRR